MEEDKKYVQMRTDFRKFLEHNSNMFFQDLEKKRKRALAIFAFLFIALFIIVLILIIYKCFTVDNTKFICAGLLIIPVLAYFNEKRYESLSQQAIMPFLCKAIGNLRWEKNSPSNKIVSMVNNTNLFGSYNSSDFDDCFIGTYKGLQYEICEAEFRKITRNGKHSHVEIKFDGVMLLIKMNKNFVGTTLITPDSLLHVHPNYHLRHTVLEDVIFEKKFDVFTDNEVEARYLITTSFMEKMNNLRTSFLSNKSYCAFQDNYLLIALSTSKNLFRFSNTFKSVYDKEQYYEVFNEIISIIKLIEYFNLNLKLGL